MSIWTADSSTVTADSSVFTADGGAPPSPPSSAFFNGASFAQSASIVGQYWSLAAAQFIAPAPQVRARRISWEQVCRMAGRFPVEWYPVYHFGAGPVDRIFTQKV